MSRPCRECPFNRSFVKTYPRMGVRLFLTSIADDPNPPCHMGSNDPLTPCTGAKLFREGGHEDMVFRDEEEMYRARTL